MYIPRLETAKVNFTPFHIKVKHDKLYHFLQGLESMARSRPPSRVRYQTFVYEFINR